MTHDMNKSKHKPQKKNKDTEMQTHTLVLTRAGRLKKKRQTIQMELMSQSEEGCQERGTDHTHTPESSLTRVPGVWAPGPPVNIRMESKECCQAQSSSNTHTRTKRQPLLMCVRLVAAVAQWFDCCNFILVASRTHQSVCQPSC